MEDEMNAFLRCLLLALAAGAMFNSGVVLAQGAPATPAKQVPVCVPGVPPQDVGDALKGVGRLGTLGWQELLAGYRQVNSLVGKVAAIKRWEKNLPQGIRDQVQAMIDEAVRETLANKPNAAQAALDRLGSDLDALVNRVNGIDDRVKQLEATRKEKVELPRRDVTPVAPPQPATPTEAPAVVNLAPMAVGYVNANGSGLLGGLRLTLPAKKLVFLNGYIAFGTTNLGRFTVSASVDLVKRMRPWFSIGAGAFVDVVDDVRKPGVTSASSTYGLRTVFHKGKLDVGLGVGVGSFIGQEGSDWDRHADVFVGWRLF